MTFNGYYTMIINIIKIEIGMFLYIYIISEENSTQSDANLFILHYININIFLNTYYF